MKTKPIFFLCLLLSVFVAATSYASAATTVQQRLISKKWQLNQQIYASHDQSGTDSSAVAGSKNDFLEFKADGSVLVSFKGNKDTLQYKIINDTILNLGTNNYIITQLSDNSLHLYQNEEEQNGDYNREWLQLRK
jgi:hypothetical protein